MSKSLDETIFDNFDIGSLCKLGYDQNQNKT